MIVKGRSYHISVIRYRLYCNFLKGHLLQQLLKAVCYKPLRKLLYLFHTAPIAYSCCLVYHKHGKNAIMTEKIRIVRRFTCFFNFNLRQNLLTTDQSGSNLLFGHFSVYVFQISSLLDLFHNFTCFNFSSFLRVFPLIKNDFSVFQLNNIFAV